NFAFIIYPESIPENWVECLSKLGIPMAVSPLHDLDESERKFSEMSEAEKAIINSGNKVYKKAHYHVLYIARNPVTVESVRKKIKRVLGDNSISHIEIVDSVEYYFQYLTHESSGAVKKNKHRYDKKDIVYINDFDIDRYVTLDESEKRELANLIFALIRKYQLENIIDLYEFVEARGD
ncbi:Rep family protein, partial [Clostridium perfringens]|uniref:Rep family protein n=1 Tax=Clostridium perfringens TaxID=1502 RepID=UPI0039ED6BA4